MNQPPGLFEANHFQRPKGPDPKGEKERPLAARLRPQTLEEFLGSDQLLKAYPFIKNSHLPSMILHGPAGCGKTTLAKVLAKHHSFELYSLSAVECSVTDLKKLMQKLRQMRSMGERPSVVFLDEIHRFNRAQQDALLPFVEEGDLILIGATTEWPRSVLNRALLSRVQLVELRPPSLETMGKILERAKDHLKISSVFPWSDVKGLILQYSPQDPRRALGFLELAINESKTRPIQLQKLEALFKKSARFYDRSGNEHYDSISAFIKSMRGSDPDSALLWLARMLDGGEDPVYIARRMVVFASEDIGNADPRALTLAVSTLTACEKIGIPEARIILAQACTFLTCAPKSNSSYLAIEKALKFVEERGHIPVPEHLKNHPRAGSQKYIYPHNFPNHFTEQDYSGVSLSPFYEPSDQGEEEQMRERQTKRWGIQARETH